MELSTCGLLHIDWGNIQMNHIEALVLILEYGRRKQSDLCPFPSPLQAHGEPIGGNHIQDSGLLVAKITCQGVFGDDGRAIRRPRLRSWALACVWSRENVH